MCGALIFQPLLIPILEYPMKTSSWYCIRFSVVIRHGNNGKPTAWNCQVICENNITVTVKWNSVCLCVVFLQHCLSAGSICMLCISVWKLHLETTILQGSAVNSNHLQMYAISDIIAYWSHNTPITHMKLSRLSCYILSICRNWRRMWEHLSRFKLL